MIERIRIYFANPAVGFISAWIAVIALCSLRWLPAFENEYVDAINTAAFIIGCFCAGYALTMIVPSSKADEAKIDTFIPPVSLRLVFVFWLAASAFETIASDGLPILWLHDGSGRTYEEYGVRGFHGFMNSVWMFLSFGYLINLSKKPNFENAACFTIMIVWVILVLSRALLLLSFVQWAIYLLASRNMRFWYALPIAAIGAMAVIFIFGKLGDARSPQYNIYHSVAVRPSEETRVRDAKAAQRALERKSTETKKEHYKAEKIVPVNAPAGIVWGYSYLIAPIANLAYNIREGEPEYNMPPTRTINLFLPTIVKRMLGIEVGYFGDYGMLAHRAFNVSTGFREAFVDFGQAGIGVLAALLGVVSNLVWRLRFNPENGPFICAMSMCGIYTVFNLQHFQPMIIVYLAMIWLAPRILNRRPTLATSP